jgi:hypothetical protein
MIISDFEIQITMQIEQTEYVNGQRGIINSRNTKQTYMNFVILIDINNIKLMKVDILEINS